MNRFRQEFFTFNLWFAYTVSVVASVFFGIYAVGDCIDLIKNGGALLQYLFFASLFIAIIGCAISFFKRKPGALLMLLGGLAMVAWYVAQTPPNMRMAIVYGTPFVISGAFLLLPDRK